MLASYTWSNAEDTTTDFQSEFVPENNGFGRNPADPTGLPIGFDPLAERMDRADQRGADDDPVGVAQISAGLFRV